MFAYANMTNVAPPADSRLGSTSLTTGRGNDETPFPRHPREGEDLLTFLQRMFAYANMTNVTPPADSRMRGNDEDDV